MSLDPFATLTFPVSAEQVRQPVCHTPAHARPLHLVILYQAPQVVVQRQLGTVYQTDRFTTGDVGIYPAGEYGPIQTNGPVDNLVLAFHRDNFHAFADTRLNDSTVRLVDQFKLQDPLLTALAKAWLRADGTDPVSGLYIESLTNTLFHHLFRYYCHSTREQRAETGKLAAGALSRIDELLMNRIHLPLRVEMLAELAHCSVFHFSRLFKNTTGRSPYQYVSAYRVQRAKVLLQTTTWPVQDIAYQLGFSSASHFDRFFRQQTGVTPLEYRRHG